MSEKKWTLLRIGIEGIYPESAVARLKRAKITLYYIKKVEKNVLELCIERKCRKKVFTILNNSCYNIVYAKNYGLSRIPVLCREKAGMLIGCALFGALCLLSCYPVLKIEVVGSGAYYEEKVIALLAESGIAEGKGYDEKTAPQATAKILALDDVSFCSVKKSGCVLTVEVQVSPQATLPKAGEQLRSPATGEIYALTVLCGEAQKAVGDSVEEGETIVSAKGMVMASVRVLCRTQTFVAEQGADRAYAEALLKIGAEAEIRNHTEEKTETGYIVAVEYIVTEILNM